ncbi:MULTISPECIES: flavin reductase family protein [unclassified Beijerinckia]|uniref:flavin reductase family protein n=1 Tax=unclassified Beijerinckia TaxID=2638183 RepID=UPI0008953B7A|nr:MULTISPECIES: flavin reductase family protein [unclassified Beijerinckia]MDH7799922.1 flavin reductase (DIM6/NTAB) family NADH-FMN oxidoreductase RutF [Beijerinckia sp. GAS462]SED42608.1 NADH-FMN oxidoreductase RutF, flavin reductase (DIM6/NTAB) family [Beijerinckia sp. 28-YEA-48]
MFFEPHKRDKSILPHDPFKAMIAPRPVGWISSMNRAGQVNLAPYSFFNAFCDRPPIVGFCSDGEKDSKTFAAESGEFVWNMATYALRDQVNASSAPLPRGDSEFVHAGLETAPSQIVKAPRVAASPCALECKVTQVFELTDTDGKGTDRWMVIGQVVGLHVDDAYIANGRIDVLRMKPIARCGYMDYTAIESFFQMQRPAGAGNAGGGG